MSRTQRIVHAVLGVCGVILLVISCAMMPTIADWSVVYPPVWVYLGLFIVMMIAGALLNKGMAVVGQWWRMARAHRSEVTQPMTVAGHDLDDPWLKGASEDDRGEVE